MCRAGACGFAAAIGVLVLFSPAAAQTLTWDGQQSGSPSDASGVWINDGATTNWNNSGTPVVWSDSANAAFGAGTSGSYSVTLGSNVSPTSIAFNTPGYTVAPDANNYYSLVAGSGGIAVQANVAGTITAPISGGGGLTVSGTGTLTVAGANTYSGATTILNGTLALGVPNVPLFLDPVAATAESWFGGPLGRTPTNAIDGAPMTPNNPVIPTSLSNNSAGQMWLSDGDQATWIAFDLGAAYKITGFELWNYNEPSLTGRGVQTAGMYVGTTMPANNDTYADQGPSWGTLAQSFTFTEGAGSTGLAGTNSYFTTPVTTRYVEMYVGSDFNGGGYTGISQIRFLAAASPPALPIGTPVSIATGATLDLRGVSQQVASLNDYAAGSQGTVTNSATTPVTLTLGATNGLTSTFSGTISDNPSGALSLVISGNFTQVLAGTNIYTGGTTISAGMLQFANTAALPSSGAATVNSGGILAVSAGGANQFTNATSGPGSIGGVLAAATWNPGSALGIDTTNAAGGVLTYSGSINGNEGLTKLGGGTLTLSAANAYNGPTTVSGGTLNLSNQNAVQNSTLTAIGTGGIAFDSSVAGNAFTLGALSGSGNISLQNNAATPNAVALTVGGNNASTTYSGVLSGLGSLVKSGNGVMTVANSNTYSGATTILGGTLKLAYPTLFLQPTAATAESWFGQPSTAGRTPTNAIDGLPMTPNNPVTPLSTSGNNGGQMWLSDGDYPTWIAFDLGANYTLTGLHLWNSNEFNSVGRGVQTAGMYVGTTMPANNDTYADQGPNWGTLAQSYTFAIASGGTADPGANYAFSTPVNSRYVELYVGSNFGGGGYTGISQILFDVAHVVPVLPVGTPVSIATESDPRPGRRQPAGRVAERLRRRQPGAVTNSAPLAATLTLGATNGSTSTFSGDNFRQSQRRAEPGHQRQLHAGPGGHEHLHGWHDDLGRHLAICQPCGPPRLRRGDGQRRRFGGQRRRRQPVHQCDLRSRQHRRRPRRGDLEPRFGVRH